MDGPDSLKHSALAPRARILSLPATVKRPRPGPGKRPTSATPTNTTPPKAPTQALWYALYFPQLAAQPDPLQQKILLQLAQLVQEVSSTVSCHPLALVCEIRSSLNYFGGIETIHDKLRPSLRQQLAAADLSEHFLYAASPTISGSLLLARSGHNALVYRRENLRSALGQLPTAVLDLNREQNRRLYNMGVRHLRDIWRLPGDGLRKRFGSDFINLLNKALGLTPEPIKNYLPPPVFSTSYDLPYEVEQLDRLLPVADEMLAQLCDYLRRRDLSTSHLLFSLSHDKRGSTMVPIGLRQASRNRQHLLMLLETHFGSLSIPAPISAVNLTVKNFDAFMGHSDELKLDAGARVYSDKHLDGFIEQLQARLGDRHVKSISTVAEHCPEHACQQRNYLGDSNTRENSPSGKQALVSNPRPLWLLTEPRQLTVRRGMLYHRTAITLVSGPERIETRWWSGAEIRRDYYVAREGNGSRLWVYHEKGGEKNWYLHGFFA